jgi:hypothetical protein
LEIVKGTLGETAVVNICSLPKKKSIGEHLDLALLKKSKDLKI